MGLINQIFKPRGEREYERAMRERKYERAIQVAQDSKMDTARVVDAAKAWLEREWEKGNFEIAAQIGTQYRLSKKRTHEAADKALDAALKAKQIERAHQLIERYELDKRKLLIESDKIYQHEMEAENFKQAADIARRAGLDRERIEKAVSRAFKKALRDKDDATLADMGQLYADFDLDWEKVRSSTINLMVGHLLGQVWGKAIEVAEKYHLHEADVDIAFEQAAQARYRYLESLRQSLVVKEGEARTTPAVEELLEEIRTGYRREREKRAAGT